ncbi:MAG: S41 family peptidase [Chitinophagaceae bacterium]
MTTRKKLNTWLPLLFAVVMIAGMSIGYTLRENTAKPGSLFKKQKTTSLQQVLDLVQLKYVDAVSPDTLADDAIQQVLSKLDPHSIYIPATNLGEVNEDLQGNFQGIGVEFNIFSDTVNIITVMDDGPSDKAGMHVGDKILKVGDSVVAGNGINTTRIKKLLRGPGASSVVITVLRDNKPTAITVQRGIIPIVSVDAAYMMNKDDGYIHINKFSETTYREFMKSLQTLQKQGLKKLMLDLRDNGGGILQEAVEIADEFLDGTKLIVYTQGNNSPKQEYRCKRDGIFETGKLVVLVNEGTASASEVLTGALQDWDRAEIIGRRTYGKGLVQEQYDLTDGSALRLTVARYYTPVGRSIQKPYSQGEEAYASDISNRYHNGEMTNADSNHVQQKGKAYKTKAGRDVYGGGGIMPDVFVSVDTTVISRYFSALYANNTLSNFAYRYYMQHQAELKAVPSATQFFNQYKSSEPLWNQFAAFAVKDSVNIPAFTARDKEFAQQRLISLIARQQWKNNGFYEVLNANDATVKKGADELDK